MLLGIGLVSCLFLVWFLFFILFSFTHITSSTSLVFDLASVAHPPLYLTTYQTGQEIIVCNGVLGALKMHGLAYHKEMSHSALLVLLPQEVQEPVS